jgi:hypothetical protein
MVRFLILGMVFANGIWMSKNMLFLSASRKVTKVKNERNR